jgi:hypothetical protein
MYRRVEKEEVKAGDCALEALYDVEDVVYVVVEEPPQAMWRRVGYSNRTAVPSWLALVASWSHIVEVAPGFSNFPPKKAPAITRITLWRHAFSRGKPRLLELLSSRGCPRN